MIEENENQKEEINENENEEEQYNSNEENNNNNDDELKKKLEDFKKKEIEYLETIKELEEQIENEKQKNELLQNPEQEISQIKLETSEIEKQINNLYTDNSNQREKLEKLSKKVDERLLKLSFKKISNKVKSQRLEDIKNKNKIEGSNDLTIQEKQLNNINQLIEIFKNDNKELKKKCECIGNLNGRFKLIDKNKKYKILIEQLNNEIKQKKKLLKEHSKCDKKKEFYNKNLVSLKDELDEVKIKKII